MAAREAMLCHARVDGTFDDVSLCLLSAIRQVLPDWREGGVRCDLAKGQNLVNGPREELSHCLDH